MVVGTAALEVEAVEAAKAVVFVEDPMVEKKAEEEEDEMEEEVEQEVKKEEGPMAEQEEGTEVVLVTKPEAWEVAERVEK